MRHNITFSILGGKGGSKRKGGHPTPKTCPSGVFWVFNMRAEVKRLTNTSNTSFWACLMCLSWRGEFVTYCNFLVLAQPLLPSSPASAPLPWLLLAFYGFHLPSNASAYFPLASNVFQFFPALFMYIPLLFIVIIICHCYSLSPLSYCRYSLLFVLTIYSPVMYVFC